MPSCGPATRSRSASSSSSFWGGASPMPLSRSRDYLSIGEVLDSIKTDFPDMSISKIRFLEAAGLIEPDRTSSGYRKFYESDVERLRHILSLQRDHFMPLKVIKERLMNGELNGG